MDKETNYISLQEATKFCNYSQEYLSLRARQGRMKAVKFGRNWVTKREWLDEYLQKVEEYKNNNLKVRAVKFVAPPKNLPIVIEPVSRFRFVFSLTLVFILLITGITLGKTSFKNVYGDISRDLPFLVREINENFDRGLADLSSEFKTLDSQPTAVNYRVAKIGKTSGTLLTEYGKWLLSEILNTGQKIVESYNATNNFVEQKLGEFARMVKKAPQVLVRGYIVANNFIEQKISQGIKTLTQLFKAPEEELVKETQIPKPEKKGMVVIPSTGKDEEVKEEIKAAFSDEIKVEPKDKTSGLIIPIFKEGLGDEYLYILVPIKNGN